MAVVSRYFPYLLHSRLWQGFYLSWPVVGEVASLAYGSVLADSYCTASVASDGSFGIVYIPKTSTVTINLRALRGKITAHWMDPVSGAFTVISGSPFSNSGTNTFTSPGVNSDGIYTDWILLLDAERAP